MIMNDLATIQAHEHPEGRIYCNLGGRAIAPMYISNDYIQWSEEHQKYGLYKYVGSRAPEGRVSFVVKSPGGVDLLPLHDRVGAEPSFEKALDWLLGRERGRLGR